VTPARLAARCVELLGRIEGPVAVTAPPPVVDALAARVPVAGTDGVVAGAVSVLLGTRVDPTARAATWEALAARLAAGAPLVVVDHNQPRSLWRRVAGVVALGARGLGPGRARHPVAREIRDHGFTIERLQLGDGERVQLVLARRRA
jgi:hypothetical protein